MAFRVRVSARAKRDLEKILQWLLRQGAGETGLQWWHELHRGIATLEINPRRCGIAPENHPLRLETRQLLYGSKPHVYRIVFTIEDELVNVIYIRHGRRLPMELQ